LEYAHDIHKSGSYLLELINDLLDLAKAEAGKLELSETVVNIQRVLEESVELLGPQTKEANVLVQVQIEARLPFLFGDARFLKQILINIISNAIKFTPLGGVVTIFATTNKLRGILVTISDTGIGMVSEDIPKALSSFGQITSPHNKSHRGTGLGLPLSKRLVELHGGVLNLNSQIGVGTTVTIQFPAWRSRSENGQQVVN
jgi:signal transduction histidine kinase